ncbi:sulfotransferase domain-containing protein [Sphingomonas suaedae]|uniref:Sulfotransferase domain-containing protein n=1 Tax=Sphingomonas suaedae TaxID=2599297 RepID=A0A518RCE6_9SPHN|nr:sulfotransferase domain-containing protein [Sphingomonas suaedae]QDX25125.1 sulfotransferase domain-containing protein [Sphingomonas suaedae]
MIYWLASYPRSGNTWCRAVLSNLMLPAAGESADIRRLAAPPTAISRDAFDTEFDCSSSEMTIDEVDRLRPDLYLRLAAAAREPLVIKLHCAYRTASDGRPIFPHAATAGVALIVRNPLDVALSLAPFLSMTLDEAIDWMEREDAELSRQHIGSTPALPQRIGSWSGHIASWLDASRMRLHLVRYEDLQADPVAAFGALANFLGLDAGPDRIRDAVERSRFDHLQAQELRHSGDARYFRRGQVGEWRDALSAERRERLIAAHGPMMRRLGYG